MGDINSTYLEDPRLNGHEGFGASLADFIGDMAARRDAALGSSFSGVRRSNVEALERLADHIPAVDEIRDRRIAILGDVNAAFADIRRERLRRERGSVDADEVGVKGRVFEEPTPLQRYILQTLAPYGLDSAPSPDQTLTDLAAAGVRDLLAAAGKRTTVERDRTGGLVKEVERLAAELERVNVDARELKDLRTVNKCLRDVLLVERERIEELRGMVAVEPKRPRRKMIEPNIYRTSGGGLEVAEATGKGKTKFHVVASLGEARILRDELRERSGVPDAPYPDEALEAALDAKEQELGRDLTDEEIAAVGESLTNSTAAESTAATEEVT
jgi:hypothetical protein